jgi:hypothetical protein
MRAKETPITSLRLKRKLLSRVYINILFFLFYIIQEKPTCLIYLTRQNHKEYVSSDYTNCILV